MDNDAGKLMGKYMEAMEALATEDLFTVEGYQKLLEAVVFCRNRPELDS